jgi:hypothetical protein
MTLLEDDPSRTILPVCPPSLVGQIREVLGHYLFATSTQPALDTSANDIAHGDDETGTVEKKPSNLPTA